MVADPVEVVVTDCVGHSSFRDQGIEQAVRYRNPPRRPVRSNTVADNAEPAT
jgi:hypothetical protein